MNLLEKIGFLKKHKTPEPDDKIQPSSEHDPISGDQLAILDQLVLAGYDRAQLDRLTVDLVHEHAKSINCAMTNDPKLFNYLTALLTHIANTPYYRDALWERYLYPDEDLPDSPTIPYTDIVFDGNFEIEQAKDVVSKISLSASRPYWLRLVIKPDGELKKTDIGNFNYYLRSVVDSRDLFFLVLNETSNPSAAALKAIDSIVPFSKFPLIDTDNYVTPPINPR